MKRTGRQAVWLAGGFLAASLVFTLWPGIDLWASGLFHDPATEFFWAANPVVAGLRRLILWLMYGAALVAIVAAAVSALGIRVAGIPGRLWTYLATLFVSGPILLVNGLFKEHWGRARPAHIVEFGGDATFTPALRITDQCASNCSFVSGEGAGATALAVAILLLAPWLRLGRGAVAALLLIPAVGLLLRIATGRHFLSDTVFAVLLVLAVALLLHRLFRLENMGAPNR